LPLFAPVGTKTTTSNVQDVPAAKLAFAKTRVVDPVNVEPVPQKPSVGNSVAAKPVSTNPKESVKLIAVAAGADAALVIVYLIVLVKPGSVGFERKALLIDKPVTITSLLVAARVTARPEVDAETTELTTVTRLGVAVDGICRVTEKVQLVPADNKAPLNVSVEVPLKLEPEPHISFCAAVVDTIPGRAESKSTVKPTLVASAVEFTLFVRVNSTVVVAPGAKVSAAKIIRKAGAATTIRLSVAATP
jgi:hypothetical protein